MMRGNSGADKIRCFRYIINSIFSGYMLKNHLKFREVFNQRLKVSLDKYCFAIKKINFCVGYFTVYK